LKEKNYPFFRTINGIWKKSNTNFRKPIPFPDYYQSDDLAENETQERRNKKN